MEVTYPSSLFSLAKDEVFPYERFAYNVLDVGVEALHRKKLPERLLVDFTRLPAGSSPWSINTGITFDLDCSPRQSRFTSSPQQLILQRTYLTFHTSTVERI